MTVTRFNYVRHDGKGSWDISELVSEITWNTDINYSAGSLDFKALDYGGSWKAHGGDYIDFQWNNQPVFKGRTFRETIDGHQTFSVLAYDNTRYLKNEDIIVFPANSAQERFQTIMQRLNLPYKSVGSTTRKLPELVCDGNTYFDMLKQSFELVYSQTAGSLWGREQFFVWDNYGVVELRAVDYNTRTDILFKDASSVSDWSFERSYDDSYNVVKVLWESDDEKKKQRKIFTAQDKNPNAAENFINRYGTLQKIEKANDNKANDAQLQAQAEAKLSELLQETREFSFTALGDIRIRAGSVAWFQSDALAGIGLTGNQRFVAESVSHKFGTEWTMQVKGRFL
ncbi:MAG: hypothetical protein LBI13_11150 [Streptococcaceae bacterium]|jgi:hypothetical protein|nr:hypothetical protein [Streptococcaceae bacterium]